MHCVETQTRFSCNDSILDWWTDNRRDQGPRGSDITEFAQHLDGAGRTFIDTSGTLEGFEESVYAVHQD